MIILVGRKQETCRHNINRPISCQEPLLDFPASSLHAGYIHFLYISLHFYLHAAVHRSWVSGPTANKWYPIHVLMTEGNGNCHGASSKQRWFVEKEYQKLMGLSKIHGVNAHHRAHPVAKHVLRHTGNVAFLSPFVFCVCLVALAAEQAEYQISSTRLHYVGKNALNCEWGCEQKTKSTRI